MSELWSALPGALLAHLQLSLAALSAGIALSVPLGIAVSRSARLEGPVLGIASVMQTIPSLALLAFMVPLLSVLGALSLSVLGIEVRSIGFLPAFLALTLYSVLPVLRNTVTGIEGVDASLVEAARGVGMSERQLLWRVQLPLALPVIVAGVRTATVWVVGTATLATPVGARSLGDFIFSGLQTRNHASVLMGSVAAAALALLLDGLVRSLEGGLRERRRAAVAFALTALCALLLVAAGEAVIRSGLAAGKARPIAIGAKTFTEQYVLAALIGQTIERETGRETESVGSLGSTVAYDALRAGEIDVYVDYSGTLWATVMKRDSLPEDRDAVLREVADFVEREHGIVMAAALGFENTYALGMRESHAAELGVRRIRDLASVSPRLEIGGDYEFFARPEWRAIESHYGLRFAEQRSMDSALMYQAVASGEVDVISAFSTDGRIAAFDLRLLEDDGGVIPPYDAIVLVGARVAREEPSVMEVLRNLEGSIDRATMQRWNWSVDSEGLSPAEVARSAIAGGDR